MSLRRQEERYFWTKELIAHIGPDWADKSKIVMYTAFFLVIVINLLIKVFPRRHFKMYGDDAWGMLIWARNFKNKVSKKDFCAFLTPPEKFYYPDFLFRLLSLFKQDLLVKFNWLISPLFDTLNLGLLFFLTHLLFNNLLITFLACVIYILFPPMIPQIMSINARVPGFFLFNSAVTLLILAKHFNSFPCLIAGLVLGGLLLDTHVFTTQAFLIVILGLSLMEKAFFYIGTLPFIFVATVILSGGFYFTVFPGHLMLIKTHYKYIYSNPYDKFDLKGSMAKSLFWGLVVLLIYLSVPAATINPIVSSLSSWVVVLFGTFILTTFIVPLRAIGEGYRYIEYALFPLSILFAYSARQYNSSFFIFVLALLVLYVLFSAKKIHSHFLALKNDYLNIVDEARLKICGFLKSSSIESVFCIPLGMAQSVAYFSGKKVLWRYYEWDGFKWLFPRIRLPLNFDLSEICQRYNYDAVLLNTKFAQKEDLNVDWKIIHQQEPYLLLEVPRG